MLSDRRATLDRMTDGAWNVEQSVVWRVMLAGIAARVRRRMAHLGRRSQQPAF